MTTTTTSKRSPDIEVQIADYAAGKKAYTNADNALYFTGSEDFQEGFRDAWAEDHRYDAFFKAGFDNWDAGFNAYVDEMQGELLPTRAQIKRRAEANAKPQAVKASVATHTITSFLLGMALAFTLALFYLAPFLMTSAEVKAFWREVLK